jgi:hypothetical protein
MGLRLVKPAAWMSRMIGRMLPPIEPLASYGPRACARLAPAGSGVPSRFPCALAAARAALVRSESASRSCSATAARMWMLSLLACGLSAATNSTAGLHEGRHEGEIFGQLIQLCDYKPSLVRAASIDGARAASLFKIRLGGFALPSHISFLPVDIQTSSSNTDISLAEVH